MGVKKKKKAISLAKLKDRIQTVVNAYIRHRDSKDGFFTCISCQRTLEVSKMQAGHYIPVSKSQFLRFNEENIHGECIGCNAFSEYHLIPYRRNLIEKIGVDTVHWLELHADDIYNHTREELESIKQYYVELLAGAKK